MKNQGLDSDMDCFEYNDEDSGGIAIEDFGFGEDNFMDQEPRSATPGNFTVEFVSKLKSI